MFSHLVTNYNLLNIKLTDKYPENTPPPHQKKDTFTK